MCPSTLKVYVGALTVCHNIVELHNLSERSKVPLSTMFPLPMRHLCELLCLNWELDIIILAYRWTDSNHGYLWLCKECLLLLTTAATFTVRSQFGWFFLMSSGWYSAPLAVRRVKSNASYIYNSGSVNPGITMVLCHSGHYGCMITFFMSHDHFVNFWGFAMQSLKKRCVGVFFFFFF